MANILIIEDENSIANLICTTLSVPGHHVERAPNGPIGLEMVEETHYDLVILDLMLGEISGEEILVQLVNLNIPVIVVSAKSNLQDQIYCLRLGADDYITKPFNSLDLITRVEVTLRVYQKQKTPQGMIHYRHVTIDRSTYHVSCHKMPIELTPKEYELLLYLIDNAGSVLSREQLIRNVWGYTFSKDNRTVDIHIQRLRKKLELQDFLKTVMKVGYILELDHDEK